MTVLLVAALGGATVGAAGVAVVRAEPVTAVPALGLCGLLCSGLLLVLGAPAAAVPVGLLGLAGLGWTAAGLPGAPARSSARPAASVPGMVVGLGVTALLLGTGIAARAHWRTGRPRAGGLAVSGHQLLIGAAVPAGLAAVTLAVVVVAGWTLARRDRREAQADEAETARQRRAEAQRERARQRAAARTARREARP